MLICGRDDNAYWPIPLCVCRSNAWQPTRKIENGAQSPLSIGGPSTATSNFWWNGRGLDEYLGASRGSYTGSSCNQRVSTWWIGGWASAQSTSYRRRWSVGSKVLWNCHWKLSTSDWSTQRSAGGRWSPHSVGWRKYGWCCASVHLYLQKHKVNKLLFDLIHTTTGERIPLPKKRIISSRSSSMKSRTRLAASV